MFATDTLQFEMGTDLVANTSRCRTWCRSTVFYAALIFASSHRPKVTLGISINLQKTSDTQNITGNTTTAVKVQANANPTSVSLPPEMRYMYGMTL